MTPCNYQVRRATIDDLVVLRRLWQEAGLAGAHLEKRLTEFQVAETAQGEVLGAMGLQLAQQQGRVHSETYKNSENAVELRARLWERVQTVSRNHGLTRLWIENQAPIFWLEQGFEPAESEVLQRLPNSLASGEGTQWLTLKLRDEAAASTLVEQEFEAFRQSQQEERARIARQTRVMRSVAGVLAAVLLAILGLGIWHLLQQMTRNPAL